MKRVSWIVGVVLIVAPLVLADAPQTGVVTGTVLDPAGAPMPGATVQLESERGTLTTVADAEGKFRFVFLQPGPYRAQADLQGFQSAAGEIVVSAGGRADVQLQLGDVMGEEILVTGEAPLVDRYDMTSGGTLDPKELTSITGQGQQYRSRLLFLPDVFNEEDSQDGGRPSIAGLTGSRQMYFIDGVDVSFARWGGGSQLQLPATAVGEMKLESTGADAQFSRSVGAYTRTIVRSGTNDFHGSGFVQAQNLDWDAANKNVDVAQPDEIFYGYDISLGGPILRDKLWFYLGYRDIENPGLEVMANGVDTVESGTVASSQLAKLDWRPNASHSVAAMYVLTPTDFPWWNRATYGNLPTVAMFEYPGDITTLRWNYAITDSLLLTAHAATTSAEQNRSVFAESAIDPSCGPEQPCGNAWLYRPFNGDRLFRNGFGLPLGVGDTEFPRDQLNAAVDLFAGVHEIKAGVDYQQLEWTVAGVTPPFCRGYFYNPSGPGGFDGNVATTPPAQLAWCRFYPNYETWATGWGPTVSGSDNLGVFVRDKMAFDRWTLNVGVRADQQVHENDVGETVVDTTEIAPRLAVSYDLTGDSKLLLQGTAGRYYAQIEMTWAAAFNREGQGRVGGSPYEQYRFNPASGVYEYERSVAGSAGRDIVQLDPYYKDEVTLGLEWQFHDNWAFKATASAWETGGYNIIYDQIDDTGELNEVIEQNSDIETERQAISLSVQRRFRNNWMFAASYVYSNTEGNCNYLDNGGCEAGLTGNGGYGALRHFTNDDGVPWSQYNRWGSLNQDRPHNIKVRGAYNWQLGKGHVLQIGGLAYYHSGARWSPWESLADAVSGLSIPVYMEPRGSRQLDARQQLDFNLQWSFPIAGSFDGWLRAEILNLFDEQVQIGTAGMAESCNWPTDNIEGGSCTATPTPVSTNANFQFPRTIRLQVGFNF